MFVLTIPHLRLPCAVTETVVLRLCICYIIGRISVITGIGFNSTIFEIYSIQKTQILIPIALKGMGTQLCLIQGNHNHFMTV